jgi:hypothetical protein
MIASHDGSLVTERCREWQRDDCGDESLRQVVLDQSLVPEALLALLDGVLRVVTAAIGVLAQCGSHTVASPYGDAS